ncbi:M28 family peptidase [Hymenobacter sp. NST-14]|uniref:M28 family metallopeptidase n=1 Tax=Hymenobacter piscis TaxID=2839984 RepID=UPI001C0172C5|nr:M28 family peptidase [Hymenobacter piscis]MBT9393289.1 M28 family peptidase [Hymenobacter piscis]
MTSGSSRFRLLVLLALLGARGLLAPPAPAQDLRRARQTIACLASPALHGRGYVNRGEQRAARFVQKQFRALGLLPLTSAGYYQPFTLPINTFPGRAALAVNQQPLRPGLDFIADAASGSGSVRGPVRLLDTLIFTQPTARTALLATPLAGTVLVLTQAQARRLPSLPAPVQAHLAAAAARITLVPKLTASLAGEQQPQPRLEVLASSWPAPARTVALQLEARLLAAYPTQNVIGYLPGTARPDSFLVVSAHYDHLGRLGCATYFPGANDNASGVAMLLELAAYYAQPAHRPACSVVFMAFGAEEAGLLGSRYFVEHPWIPLSRIRFLVNLDLLGTGDDGLTVVNGRVFEEPFRQLQHLNAQQQYVGSLAARGRAANSDHYYFSERGVPAFFFYTRGGSPAYHDVLDRSETLSLTAFGPVFRLLRDFLNGQGAAPSTK